jgi:hypothetical protein
VSPCSISSPTKQTFENNYNSNKTSIQSSPKRVRFDLNKTSNFEQESQKDQVNKNNESLKILNCTNEFVQNEELNESDNSVSLQVNKNFHLFNFKNFY